MSFFRNGTWRVFVIGALCGAISVAVVWAASAWWKPRPERSLADDDLYDRCLVTQQGNTIACDALMRTLDRERAGTAAMKKEAAKLLAAGFTKREVVEWARKQGFTGSQLSDAVGISWEDLRDDKY
jgi:hypothetical protein